MIHADQRSASRRRVAAAASCALLASLPFLVVTFPPITDLAQHAAQVRLFLEAVGDPSSPYEIQWLTPYSLCYVVLGAAWALFGPLAAGRLGAMALVVAGVVAIHWLAARRGRPVAAAALATVFLFSHVLYWGFLSFVAGLPLFLLFVEVERASRGRPLGLAAVGRLGLLILVLYFTHALWFAAACTWVVLRAFDPASGGLLARPRLAWGDQAARLLALLPGALLAVAWFPHLAARRFVSQPLWATWGAGRLAPGELRADLLGGLDGVEEPLFLAVIGLWIAAGVFQHRRSLRESVDRELLFLAGLFLVAALFLPDKYMNTIRFAQRWMPVAAILGLLALPSPRLVWRRALAGGLTAAFLVATALTWRSFEREELGGFETALAALPPKPRLMGLDYVRESPRLTGSPFFQMFAYGQVLRGGEVNFSFADFAPSLVVYRELRYDTQPWTSGLEWFPHAVRFSDVRWFDHVLIHGDPVAQARIAGRAGLEPIGGAESWLLYRVPASKRLR